jgi:hypothetical protein
VVAELVVIEHQVMVQHHYKEQQKIYQLGTYAVVVGAGGTGGTCPTYSSRCSGQIPQVFQQSHQQEVVVVVLTIVQVSTRIRWRFRGRSGTSGPYTKTGGSGNTPPVSPPQGNPGGAVTNTNAGGGGGGGATGAGSPSPGTNTGGAGGAGAPNDNYRSAVTYAGGGGGGGNNSGGPSLRRSRRSRWWWSRRSR